MIWRKTIDLLIKHRELTSMSYLGDDAFSLDSLLLASPFSFLVRLGSLTFGCDG
jgi:hypothetical protein